MGLIFVHPERTVHQRPQLYRPMTYVSAGLVKIDFRARLAKAMNRIAEENSARRIQSFDTVLPDEVRAKFTRPHRPRILGRLEFPDRNILWLAGAIVFWAMIVALAIRLRGPHEK